MKVTQVLLAAGILAAASSAHAGIYSYDFNGFADGTNLSGVDLGGLVLDGGVVNGGVVSSNAAVSGSIGMFGVINVSLDISGDALISAYDLGGAFINGTNGNSGSLTVFAPGAASLSFGAAGGFSFDNLTLETIGVAGGGFGPGGQAAVPVPAALPLMATALAGVAYLGMRRRK